MPGSIGQYFWGGLAGTTFWVDPAEQLFALLLIQPPDPVFNGAIVFSNGAPQFSGSGYPTLPYRVEVSTNLSSTNWTTVGSISADSNGNLFFTDTNSTGQSQRFYRFVTP